MFQTQNTVILPRFFTLKDSFTVHYDNLGLDDVIAVRL